MLQVQFQNVKQKQIQVQRFRNKIEIPQSQEAMRSKVARMTLEKTLEEQDTLNQAVRAWSIECLRRYSRDPLVSIKQGMEVQAEAEHSKRRVGRVKETSRAKSIRHEESNGIAIVLNNSY